MSRQINCVGGFEMQSINFIAHGFGRSAHIADEYGTAGGKGFLNYQRVIFVPDGWHDHYIQVTKEACQVGARVLPVKLHARSRALLELGGVGRISAIVAIDV